MIKYSKIIKKIIKDIYDKLIVTPLKFLISIENIIILESHSDFTDNSKALFNEMIKNKINNYYKIVWLVEDIDKFNEISINNVTFFKIKHKNLLRKIKCEVQRIILFSKCKYVFFTHRNYARSKPKNGQVFFNLTHGTPLKDSTGMHNSIKYSSYILTTSKFAGELRCKTYGGGEKKLRYLGFPRNDFLFENKETLSALDIDKNKYEKFIIWMPTFRRHKSGARNDTRTRGLSDLPVVKNKNDWSELSRFLEEKRTLLIIKPHPAQDLRFFNGKESSHIKIVTNTDIFIKGIELYNLLGESDALITDYSSVFMDYLILDRQIAFTVDDIAEYSKGLGFLVENPLEYMPGPKIESLRDMICFIEDVHKNNDICKNERNRVCKLFNLYNDNNSSMRLLTHLGLLNDKNI